MTRHLVSLFTRSVFALVVSAYLTTSVAQAETFSFSDIEQSTQTPDDPDDLYGDPDTSSPNMLLFAAPQGFASTSTVPSALSDVTDGLLTFTASADDDLTFATGFWIEEAGAYLIQGPDANLAGVRVNGLITITEIDNAPVNGMTIPFSFNDTDFEGDGGVVSGVWELDGYVDFTPYGRVTAFDVAMNNTLFTMVETGSSFIDKKRIKLTVHTELIPEPSTVALSVLGLCAMACVVRRQRA